ncbi:TetR/AcrR family transcriptional regulator [Cellulomonas sp. KRMCY2]|uniref:TetR/AcrR family transcriptional regulator n=1 Tax=Cellulomonas sp. KRMCY2 TaxID=1304865 RepID=UPI00045EC6EB|nr:TetR/AcrR family transcriptional regulator [Cellulomonas sp. KRMCY2]
MARTPRTRTARQTADRVLDGALELFNRDGTARVTTNHIAAHVGISPGNLYYWYADKPEIIRALWTRFADAHGVLWEAPEGPPPGPDQVLARLSAATELSRTYRFLARDMLALVHGDPELHAAYVANREHRLAALTGLARSWRASGVIRAVDDDRLEDVVRALWILAETWWSFAELDSAEGDPDPRVGENLLRAVIEPYLSTGRAT